MLYMSESSHTLSIGRSLSQPAKPNDVRTVHSFGRWKEMGRWTRWCLDFLIGDHYNLQAITRRKNERSRYSSSKRMSRLYVAKDRRKSITFTVIRNPSIFFSCSRLFVYMDVCRVKRNNNSTTSAGLYCQVVCFVFYRLFAIAAEMQQNMWTAMCYSAQGRRWSCAMEHKVRTRARGSNRSSFAIWEQASFLKFRTDQYTFAVVLAF